MFEKSKIAHTNAQRYLPGGVNSPVRAYSKLCCSPVYIQKAQGAWLTDLDNNQYIDFVGAFGPHLLGHNPPTVLRAINQQIQDGLCFGTPHLTETALCETIIAHLPSIEKIRLVSSGTEATMTAIRLARAYTNKKKIIKFAGCYHGHHDAFLIEAGSGALTNGTPSSAGVSDDISNNTLIASYNDITSVIDLFETHHKDIAAVIIEPIAGNMNCILPKKNFLNDLQTLCEHNNSLLIFDEVMTGFRVALGGAQTLYNIKPDLTTLGKIIGGGFPVGAVGGKKEILNLLAPTGPVYQAGTLSGHPVAVTAGLSVLKQLKQQHYIELEKKAHRLTQEMQSIAASVNMPLQSNVVGGMFGLFLGHTHTPTSYAQVTQGTNQTLFKAFHYACLQAGLYLAPSPFEAAFLSTAHDDKIITTALNRFHDVFQTLATFNK